MEKMHQHNPNGSCLHINGDFGNPVTITYAKETEGDDMMKMFVSCLVEHVKWLYNNYKFKEPMVITDEEQESFEYALVYHICKGQLERDSVRDHCCMTGKYTGVVHSICNLHFTIAKFYPVFFHNLWS